MNCLPKSDAVSTPASLRITSREIICHFGVTLFLVGLVGFARHKIARDDGLRAAITNHRLSRQTVIVARKWQHRDFNRSGDVVLDTPASTTYWVAWNTDAAGKTSQNRINLSPRRWEEVEVGGRLEILSAPGTAAPLTRDDIALSQGNRRFDVGLLWSAAIGAALSLLFLPVSLYAWRHPDALNDEAAPISSTSAQTTP